MWDLGSLTRVQIPTPCIARWNLNHWTAREVPRAFKKLLKLLTVSRWSPIFSSPLFIIPWLGTDIHPSYVYVYSFFASHYLVAQSCPTLCDAMDCSLPGSSAHGIFQSRILEWVTTSFFRGSPWSRNWTHISCIGKQILYHWAPREAPLHVYLCTKYRNVSKWFCVWGGCLLPVCSWSLKSGARLKSWCPHSAWGSY